MDENLTKACKEIKKLARFINSHPDFRNLQSNAYELIQSVMDSSSSIQLKMDSFTIQFRALSGVIRDHLDGLPVSKAIKKLKSSETRRNQ